jgi:hypothetical protein
MADGHDIPSPALSRTDSGNLPSNPKPQTPNPKPQTPNTGVSFAPPPPTLNPTPITGVGRAAPCSRHLQMAIRSKPYTLNPKP